MSSERAPEQVIDPELWSKVRFAVLDARRAASAWIDAGHPPPRTSMPLVTTYVSGFPMLFHDLHPTADGPPNYSHLFGSISDSDTPLAYSESPALIELIEYVTTRPDLLARLVPLSQEDFGRDTAWPSICANVIAQFALTILDRAEALRAQADDSLRSIYIELEQGLLATDLPADLVVPLALTRMELDQPLEIGEGIRIEPMDDSLNAARAPSTSSGGIVPLPVVSAATHAVVIEGLSIPNADRHERVYAGIRMPLPLDAVNRVVEALRVLTPVPVGYAQILIRPIGWADGWTYDLPPVRTVASVRAYPEAFDDGGWLRPGESISRADMMRLPKIFHSLQQARPEVKLAARRLSQAELRTDDDDKTVDACIGLEALLSNETTELTHRLGLRAAAALANNIFLAWNATDIYMTMKTIYNHRSAIVHGSSKFKYRSIRRNDSEMETPKVATMMLRLLLLDLIERTDPWTPEILDQTLLRSLDASHGTHPGHD